MARGRKITEKTFALALKRLHTKLPQRALVACSGGVDSIVLLELVCARYARAKRAEGVTVIHFDHGQRSSEDAVLDQAVVEHASHRLGVQARFEKLVLPKGASEAEMRTARYDALARLCNGDGVVFTAHHADDDLETYLFKLLRGAHPDSIKGIAARASRVVGGRRIRLARPLLEHAKSDLIRFAREKGLEWREDSSNQSKAYARNRLRIELLPLLESLRPGASARLLRFFRQLGEQRGETTKVPAMTGQLRKTQGLAVQKTDFPALREAVLELLGESGSRATQAHWFSVRRQLALRHSTRTGGGPTKTVQFPGGHALTFRGQRVFWEVF